MCRVLAYLGEPVLLDDLLYGPDNSLVRQSYAPQRLRMLNLAGFGVAAWDPESREPGEPYTYHTPGLPAFDSNLRTLARKVRPTCVLAHVRGVPFSDSSLVGPQFLHPFLYEGLRVALATTHLPLAQVIPRAVDEVGGPTILATFTVIAALLPMAFVSGLMGPYMAPIPINSSMGMLLSLAIAFVVTPWMALRLLPAAHTTPTSGDKLAARMAGFFERVMRPFLRGESGRRARRR